MLNRISFCVLIRQLNPTKPEQDLSQTNRPSAPIIEDWVSDSKDESETKASQIVPSFVQSTKQVQSPRHSVQHVETSTPAATPKPSSPKPTSSGKKRNRKACFVCQSLDHLIKDYDYHAKKMAQPITRNHALMVSADVPQIKVTRPKQVQPIITKPKSLIRRHITHCPSPKASNSPLRVPAVKDPVGNPQHALKDKGVIDSRCSRHMTWNMSCLSDFEELNGGYVAFGDNPNGGKISGKGKIKTGKFDGKVDEGFLVGYSVNNKAFRVFNSRTNIVQKTLHVNFLENKPNVAGNQTNPSAGFQDKFAAEKAGEEIDQQYVLFLVWSSGSTNPQNNDGDAAFDGKEFDFDAKKPESEVNVSSSSSAYINEVNDAGTIVPTVGQNSPNNTNTFSAAELKDITYSDDEDDRVHQALKDPSWIEAMQEELLQFKMKKVWVLVDLPYRKRAICTKWVFKNKNDEREIVIRNKARLVAQRHTQEEGIDYED
uniref:Retrovirus-related Pol polyprotein from transposon TNT 1-94 n=1 Tax=Tanacetum cinerariifolium TaxID=118510 RepID=A0A699HRU7_TANCI|nr:retrovirus-related Pol polyprotein from transposon TNT 1-94 [Tanacetum cinerariifolium]